ncbi:hypothetical protein PUN4_830012 [Paraburkholderia unamae]|nr:hypothetical protein PUN4_830012 [Paraburkholderia unamae]
MRTRRFSSQLARGGQSVNRGQAPAVTGRRAAASQLALPEGWRNLAQAGGNSGEQCGNSHI